MRWILQAALSCKVGYAEITLAATTSLTGTVWAGGKKRIVFGTDTCASVESANSWLSRANLLKKEEKFSERLGERTMSSQK